MSHVLMLRPDWLPGAGFFSLSVTQHLTPAFTPASTFLTLETTCICGFQPGTGSEASLGDRRKQHFVTKAKQKKLKLQLVKVRRILFTFYSGEQTS